MLSSKKLNKYLQDSDGIRNRIICQVKEWKRVDVGKYECYVGDEQYIIVIINRKSIKNIFNLIEDNATIKRMVINYLQGEGFVGEKYIYTNVMFCKSDLLD